MNHIKYTMLYVLTVTIILVIPVQAQMTSSTEALTVAHNWIARVIEIQGHWGGHEGAQVIDIQEFMRDNRVIGYFCRVEPIGYIVVSLRKELAPVKAYSDECNLNPESDEGMADILKTKMQGILDVMEQHVRLLNSGVKANVRNMFAIDYRPAWDELCGQAKIFTKSVTTKLTAGGFDQIGPLLNSNWHQDEPYNLQCPPASGDCTQENCAVGCAALAAAQIMKYWNWPPEGFDWLHMAERYIWNQNQWRDRDGNTLDQTYTNAVATLCRTVGDAVDMNYCDSGCESSADFFDMNDAYEDYFDYHVFGVGKRTENQDIWKDDIKRQLAANRLIQYAITDHSIVLDGWREDGGIEMLQYHINYGWGSDCDDTDGCNTWYSLDALYNNEDQEDEYMIVDVYPTVVLGEQLSDNTIYPKEEFNYRYFDQNTTGENVTFAAGQNLQFLPGIKLECTEGYIEFQGEVFNETQLFSIKGTEKAGINIHNGAIVLFEKGGIKFY